MVSLRAQFDEILQDHSSGSTDIFEKVFSVVENFYESKDCAVADTKMLISELNRLFFELPGFAVLFHFINQLFLQFEKEQNPEIAKSFLFNYGDKWKNANAQSAQLLLDNTELANKTILLHSNSAAIHQLIQEISKQNLQIKFFQTFSSPGGEGKAQAQKALKYGFEVDFIHESALGRFMNEIDIAIFGVDVITRNFFINKSGTFFIAALFRQFEKPVYIVSDSRKIIDEKQLPLQIADHLLNERERKQDELWHRAPEGIKVRNFWFEQTPHRFLSGLATEQKWIGPKIEVFDFEVDNISKLFHKEIA